MPQCADALICPTQIDIGAAAKRRQVELAAVFMWNASDLSAAGNCAANQRVQLRKVHVPLGNLHRLHPAADIHAHHAGNDFIRDGHGGSDGAALPGMDIRHNANFAAFEGFLVADCANLFCRHFIQLRRVAQCGVAISLDCNHKCFTFLLEPERTLVPLRLRYLGGCSSHQSHELREYIPVSVQVDVTHVLAQPSRAFGSPCGFP